jgi:hypothetical protein
VVDGSSRDVDRQAVYDVEDAAFTGTLFALPVPFDDAAALLADFCGQGWWADRALPRPTVLPTRRDSLTSYAWSGPAGPSVHLSPDGCAVSVVAHELAHVLATHLAGDGEPPHGPMFRRAEVVLAGAVMGIEAADRLALLFAGAGLPLGPAPPDVPEPPALGFWAAWRAARIRAAATVSTVEPIAL